VKGKFTLPPIRHCTYIEAPPQRVYEMLTTAAGWDAWFTQGAEVDAQLGGRIRFRWVRWGVDHTTGEDGGRVLEAVPPRRLAFQWTPGDSPTTVAFELELRGRGTVLSVTETGHTGSQGDLQALVECAAGWGEALTLLKMYLEHGITVGQVPEA
jgi:uncharacterized protein YndB with AHSA1/START domain